MQVSRILLHLVTQGAGIPLPCEAATSTHGFQGHHCREEREEGTHQLLSALARKWRTLFHFTVPWSDGIAWFQRRQGSGGEKLDIWWLLTAPIIAINSKQADKPAKSLGRSNKIQVPSRFNLGANILESFYNWKQLGLTEIECLAQTIELMNGRTNFIFFSTSFYCWVFFNWLPCIGRRAYFLCIP